MYVLAVSDFLRSLFLILVATPFILLWGCALLDLIRGNHSGWAIVGWMVVILVIPIIGPMIYFAAAQADAERGRREVPRRARRCSAPRPPGRSAARASGPTRGVSKTNERAGPDRRSAGGDMSTRSERERIESVFATGWSASRCSA